MKSKIPVVKTKKCNTCLEEKPRYEFNMNRKCSDGFNSKCRECFQSKRPKSELDVIRENVGPYVNEWTSIASKDETNLPHLA